MNEWGPADFLVAGQFTFTTKHLIKLLTYRKIQT